MEKDAADGLLGALGLMARRRRKQQVSRSPEPLQSPAPGLGAGLCVGPTALSLAVAALAALFPSPGEAKRLLTLPRSNQSLKAALTALLKRWEKVGRGEGVLGGESGTSRPQGGSG